MVFNFIKYILIMGLFSFVGDIVQDVFGGSKSRSESAEYNAQALAQQQGYAQQNMETQQGYNIQNMMMQQAFNRQNMTYQNELNIEAFNRENEYNTPLQQRLRSQAAGINQNWQDGAGVVAQQDSGVSSQTPSGGMPSPSVSGVPGVSSSLADPSSLLEGIMNLKAFKNEQDNIKAQTKKIEAEAKLAETQEKGQAIAAGLLKQFGPAEAEARINDWLASAKEKNASADDIRNMMEAKQYFVQQQGSYFDALSSEAWKNYENFDTRFNAMYGVQGLIPGQAYNQFQQGNYYGIQTDYYPQHMRNQTTIAGATAEQARAASKQARAALWNAKTNEFLSHSQDKINKALSGKYSVEAAHEIIETAVSGIEFKVSRDIANEHLPQKAARLKNREAKAIISRYKSEVLKNMSGTWQGRSRIASDAVAGSDDAFDKMCQELNDLFEE